jgi:hypothetical protein
MVEGAPLEKAGDFPRATFVGQHHDTATAAAAKFGKKRKPKNLITHAAVEHDDSRHLLRFACGYGASAMRIDQAIQISVLQQSNFLFGQANRTALTSFAIDLTFPKWISHVMGDN